MHLADQSRLMELIRLLVGLSQSCHPQFIGIQAHLKYWSGIELTLFKLT